MRRSILSNELGGAVVELAVSTFVFVPLAMYGVWFADAIHFGIKAQEASYLPAWDVTAKLLHDEATAAAPLGKLSSAATKAQSDVMADMSSSFDSADPGGNPVRQSVVARAGSLTVKCQAAGGSGAAPSGGIKWIPGAVHANNNRLPLDTWVSCSSGLTLTTSGIPADYDETRAGGIELFPSAWTSLPMCGLGQGITGCGTGPSSGFYLFTDDWACETGDQNTLSIGSPGGNDAYFNTVNDFYSSAGSPGSVTSLIAGWGDLAPNTGVLRLTYRRGGGGAYSAVESAQGSVHGGATNLHTGGPWHDEGVPSMAGQKTFAARTDSRYMAVSAWPND